MTVEKGATRPDPDILAAVEAERDEVVASLIRDAVDVGTDEAVDGAAGRIKAYLDELQRERCARVAENIAKAWHLKAQGYRKDGNNGPYLGEPTGWSIAAAIRSAKEG